MTCDDAVASVAVLMVHGTHAGMQVACTALQQYPGTAIAPGTFKDAAAS
jgi:hypothetical protein